MSETLEAVLEEHEPYTAQGGIYCLCDNWGRDYADQGSPETYAAHVADAVREWVAGVLASENVREVAAIEVAECSFGVEWRWLGTQARSTAAQRATAALTVVREALTGRGVAEGGEA